MAEILPHDMANNIFNEVERRVGQTGTRSVRVSNAGDTFAEIFLSRGGILIPGNDRPAYCPKLAIVGCFIGEPGEQGLDFGDGADLSDSDSRAYLVIPGKDGTYETYDAFAEMQGAVSETPTFTLDEARPVFGPEEYAAIDGLIQAYDHHLSLRAGHALAAALNMNIE